MDQKELRELENRCIEENPPWCLAACPVHLDGRSLCAAVAREDWAAAWKVLLRTMPLPGLLARVCDAPCREKCKRGQAGEAIAMGGLERAVVRHAPPMRSVVPLPGRGQSVAVVGAGLAGLTAAWDLGKKGYKVVVYEPEAQPAARLREEFGHEVPSEVFEAELAILAKVGVAWQTGAPVYRQGFLDDCLAQHGAAILSLDALDEADWPLERDQAGAPLLASPAQGTAIKGVFAAGLGGEAGNGPVWRAAQGRWAATSADRFLQGVSPTAGRDKDTPFQTRLFTSLEGVAPLPAVVGQNGAYGDQEAAREAGRCLQCHCLECVKVCPYLESFGSYPKKYAREIYNNQSIVMGSRLANKLINSCSLCGLCEAICPENFSMQELCLQTRREMVQKGKMPPSAHEFALLDMEFSLGPDFRLARRQPGSQKSAYVFFPGCQLAGSNPGQTARVYRHLCDSLEGGVGLMLGCCGAPAHWAGRKEQLREVLSLWHQDWLSLGAPPVIMACSSCRDVFRRSLPEVEQVFLWEVLAKTGARALALPDGPLALHDPCTTRHDPAARAGVRELLAGQGVALEELPLGGELTECCGFGGLMENANPDLAREVVARRAGQSPADYLAYCAVCRDRLASAGKRVLHGLDLFFPPEDGEDPAARPAPGWSQRRENRARLKAGLLEELWGERQEGLEERHMPALLISDQVRQTLEQRRILDDDLRKVIRQAEEGGQKLIHPTSGHFLANFQPYKAVFWVEYSPEGEGFRVHNAYSHRMVVRQGTGK